MSPDTIYGLPELQMFCSSPEVFAMQATELAWVLLLGVLLAASMGGLLSQMVQDAYRWVCGVFAKRKTSERRS